MSSNISFHVTLFYDGNCPICQRQIACLEARNHKRQLKTVSIREPDFALHYPELDLQALDELIHARLGDGSILTGMDATQAAWHAVGRGWLMVPLRWPLIRYIADAGYRLLARHRYPLARWLRPFLGKPPQCNERVCK
ncbi:thiol-disulfide oxidoreductase DCC family protein [Spongorhabdus nitratireducens]